jgi:predicted amidohydrolase
MPISRLQVFMVTQNSPDVNLADDVASRLQQLQNGFATARALPGHAAAPLAAPGTLLTVYLAPEYFFRKYCQQAKTSRVISAYTEDDKDAATAAMQLFSQQTSSLLMAGSVFWVPSALGGWQVRNTIFIYYRGVLVLTYDKRNDCAELRDWELELPYRFVPGNTRGTFAVDGLNCGVETCVDHQVGQLRRREGLDNLDLQFVISNTTTIHRTSVAAHGRGYIIHCNAGIFGTNVYQNPFDGDGSIGAPQRSADARLQHAFFDLPWPANPVAPQAGSGKLNVRQ